MPSIVYSTLALVALASSALAFQEFGGPACTTVGSACTFQYIDSSDTLVTVNAFCAPNGFCADNGATCTTGDNCYDDCGTDGICGGLGSSCDTQSAFGHNQFDIACDTPAFTCTTDGTTGSCIAATSGGSSKTRHRKRVERAYHHAKRGCSGEGQALCAVPGLDSAFECVDVLTNLESCGGCIADGVGQDCTQIVGALDVECAAGACAVSSCLPGFELIDGDCVALFVVSQ